MSALTLSLLEHVVACLVPRRHYSAWSIRNGSRGPREPPSETSPKCINREGLGKRRTGTRKRRSKIICHSNVYICGWNSMMSPDNAAWNGLFLRILPNESWFSFLRWGVGATVKGLRLHYICLQVSSYVPNSAVYIAADFAFYFTNFETFLYWRTRTIIKLTTPENTITYHNALCLSPQNFA